MYFAELDQNNIVIRVIVAEQDYINTLPGIWKQTDLNGISPKNYAGASYKYRQDLNGFVPPKPFPSWSLNESSCLWETPTPKPNDGKFYKWDEDSLSWIEQL